MKRFSFRLKVVEKLRERHEQEALQLLADAQRALQAEIFTKNRLILEMKNAYERREKLATATVLANQYYLEDAFIVGNQHRINRADHAIEHCKKKVEKRMRDYLNAKRKRSAITKLKEKEKQNYKKEVAKHEQKQLDDLTVMTHRLRAQLWEDME